MTSFRDEMARKAPTGLSGFRRIDTSRPRRLA
jgi:hypothetical protein